MISFGRVCQELLNFWLFVPYLTLRYSLIWKFIIAGLYVNKIGSRKEYNRKHTISIFFESHSWNRVVPCPQFPRNPLGGFSTSGCLLSGGGGRFSIREQDYCWMLSIVERMHSKFNLANETWLFASICKVSFMVFPFLICFSRQSPPATIPTRLIAKVELGGQPCVNEGN